MDTGDGAFADPVTFVIPFNHDHLGCSLPLWGGMLQEKALEERPKHSHRDEGEKQLPSSCAAMQSMQPLLSLQHWTVALQY